MGASRNRRSEKPAVSVVAGVPDLRAARPAPERGPWDRDHRFRLREDLRSFTEHKGARACGHRVLIGGVTQTTRAGRNAFAGLATCGMIHLCPVCGEKIRTVREANATTYADAWESAGRGVALLTATLRHYERLRLGTLRKDVTRENPHGRHGLVAVQHDAWRDAFGAGDRAWRAIQAVFGLEGYLRSWECTFGNHGPHPHFHALLFLAEPWTVDVAGDFEARALARWCDAVQGAGGYRPNKHGLRVDLPKQGDAGTVGRYLFKSQYGGKESAKLVKAGSGLVTEVTRGAGKTGRQGKRSSFEVAEDATRGVAGSAELWSEFVVGSQGVRALYLSNGMKKKLAELVDVDERTDAQIAVENEAADPIAVFPAETWYRHIMRHRGRALELLKAGEFKGQLGVRLLLLEWGLVWGVDVLDPADVRQPGAAEADVL